MEAMRMGGSIMWVILALSVGAGAIFVERLLFYRRSVTDPIRLEEQVGAALYGGNVGEALRIAASGDTSYHRLFAAALNNWEASAETLKLLLEQELRREIYRWEKGLTLLSTLARLAPLLGLLGTVLGMVEIFRLLPASSVSPMTTLAGGIWKALLTTVAGLVAAVPIVMAHTCLVSRVLRGEEGLERGADFLLREKLLGRGSVRPGAGARA
jgi:biopolymer transport protein ExbB